MQMYSKYSRIILLLPLLVLMSCSEHKKVCDDKIILKSTGSSLLRSYLTYAVATDGAGEVSCKLPKSWGDTPVWSPDKQWVAYSTQFNGQTDMESQIFVSYTNDKRIQLTYEKDGAFYPDWSSDGQRIAYEMTNGISILDVTCLYKNEKCKFNPTFVVTGTDPDWSPVNDLIVYDYQSSIESSEIRVIDVRQPNSVINATPDGVAFCQHPRWSPDGRTIAVGCYKENSYDIYLIDWANLQATNITNSPSTMETGPEWSPDGTRIAFVSDGDKNLGKCLVDECTITSTGLYIMNITGNNTTRITFRNDEDIVWFSWIP